MTCVELLPSVEMRHIIHGTDTGVGAACTGNRNGFTQKGLQRGFESFLDARRVGLPLPAAEGGTVV